MNKTLLTLLTTMLIGGLALKAETPYLLNEPVDISSDFRDFTNVYFNADSLSTFDGANASGKLKFKRFVYHTRTAFNNTLAVQRSFKTIEFPENVYPVDPELPFKIEFVSPRSFRIRLETTTAPKPAQEPSLMLVKEPTQDHTWKYTRIKGGYRYQSAYGAIEISEYPWRISIYDANGKLLTKTRHYSENEETYHPNTPFSFVRRASDYSQSVAAVFSLQPGEKIFGCGESFTRMDKRGQKVTLWTDDANGTENTTQYKPIPFFMSNRGYGMFMHTTSPITCDFGASFLESANLMIGDDQLDLFVFLGQPKEILDEYTNITGKSPMPPLWSFGLWMSRISYFSQKEGYDVAAKLRENKIPSDVIHFDTGWFENDWQCDYDFAPSRFSNPKKMIADLKKQGFHISLWQLPYFIPKNKYFKEIVEKGLCVKNDKGTTPYEDAILDFSNPATRDWYQAKIAKLLEMGVGAIKVDFGEAAPHKGLFASGKTGFYEHNYYPLRYNNTVAEVTQKVSGEHVIWARSAWAGSQRYPVHWGGDASNTDGAMLSTLHGGLSLGLSGFSFWSHDIGGFVQQTPEELYRRWLPFGMLTSHSRTHGTPPKEPWLYNPEFTDAFRKSVNLKYRLMPYMYAQAKDCSERGLPMLRALFVEFPDDPGAWQVEDQYMFGSDILVAPLFEKNTTGRNVYLPKGKWVDYQTGKQYEGGWHSIEAGEIPVVMLVRDGAVLPHIALAQSTADMDWTKIELVTFGSGDGTAKVCLPTENVLKTVTVSGRNVITNPFGGKVSFTVK